MSETSEAWKELIDCPASLAAQIGQSVLMSDDCERVTTLIKELLILNRVESNPMLEPPTVKEVEERKFKRKRIRQELVQVLYLHNRKKA